ncbi:hypothetical protein PTKIN_Ptkin10aG0018100 [Pterospermum kingtungense]
MEEERDDADVYKGWEKPDSGWVKVNCDEPFSGGTGGSNARVAGIGVVVRNEEGKLVSGLGKRITTNQLLRLKLWLFMKKERCATIFQKKGCEPKVVIWKINRMVSEIEALNDDPGLGINDDERDDADVYKGWETSDSGWVKVNL